MKRIECKSSLLCEHYDRITHDSGLEILVYPKKTATSYAIFATRFGSTDSTFILDGKQVTVPDGVAHYLEHKLFDNPDGTDSMAVFSALGAEANAFTGYKSTAYLFSCSENFSESLTELLKFVTSPYFTKETVEKEKGIIGEEIKMYDDSPWEKCYNNLLEGIYAHNSVRKNICGSAESIAKITDRILYDCYAAFYSLSNMALVVCGDVSTEEVLAVADRVLPKTFVPHSIERVEESDAREVCRAHKKAAMQVTKPIFSIGIKDPEIPSSPAERIRRDAASTLLSEVLFSRSAEFYSKLFEEGVITSSYSYGYSITDSFAFLCVSGESDRPQEVQERMRAYLQKTLSKGLSDEDIARCRNVLYADAVRGYDSSEEIANNLLSFLFDDAEPFSYPDLIRSVTKEELTSLLGLWNDPSLWCLSEVLPRKRN